MQEAITAEEVRHLRGDRTRAEFARVVGVTPLTIYRWELARSHPQSRRPRPRMLRRLKALAEGGLPSDQPGSALIPEVEPVFETPSIPRVAPSPPTRSETPVRSLWADSPVSRPPQRLPEAPRTGLSSEEDALLRPIFEHMLAARFDQAEQEALALIAADRLRTAPGDALARVSLAVARLLGREDVRGAYAMIAGTLRSMQHTETPPAVAGRAWLGAGLICGAPDGQLFNAGRVSTCVNRARRWVEGSAGPELESLLAVAELRAALHLDDRALFMSRLAQVRPALEQARGVTSSCLAREQIALGELLSGRVVEASRSFATLADRAESAGFHACASRAVARLAQLRLEAAAPVREVKALLQRGQDLLRHGRITPGFTEVLLGAVAVEISTRDGDFQAAFDHAAAAEAAAEAVGWPPVELLVPQLRLYSQMGRMDEIERLHQRYMKEPGPHRRVLTEALGRYVYAGVCMFDGQAMAASIAWREAAIKAREAGSVPGLERRAALLAGYTGVMRWDAAQVADALRQAERVVERHPSVWATGYLHMLRATYAMLDGRPMEAPMHAESAANIMRRAGDRPVSAIAGWLVALAAALSESPDAETQMEAARREVESMGMALPTVLEPERIRAIAHQTPRAPRKATMDLGSLATWTQQIAVRGVDAHNILGTLLEVITALTKRPARVEELDSHGEVVTGRSQGEALPDGLKERFELSDGCGRRFQLSLVGPICPQAHAVLEVLVTVTRQALEVAALRSMADLEPTARVLEAAETPEVPGLVAASPAMRQLLVSIERLGGSEANVLVRGESGTGKELIASAVHRMSRRRDRAYLTFNCAAVPRDLFEGQLFGYRKGAFTGATRDHAGVIRAAHQGTLFLDEIGDLPLDMQPKLLRFLENGEILPLGETRPVIVDVRVVAATHRDLGEMVRAGAFREDLYYRLQVVPLIIPPLRDRPEDILPLARHFITRQWTRDEAPPTLTPDAAAALTTWAWPGNVRELRNVMERALALAGPVDRLTAQMLDLGVG